jgi:hypothetical protein
MNRRDAYGLGAALIFALAPPAFAAGFAPLQLSDTGDVCYSWNGGHKSAGSFSKCQPVVQVAILTPMAPPPAPLPPVVQPSPVMMPMSSPAPAPKKPIVRKKRPAMTCKAWEPAKR